jgi:hypothetical protein
MITRVFLPHCIVNVAITKFTVGFRLQFML